MKSEEFWSYLRIVAMALGKLLLWCVWLLGVILCALAGGSRSSSSSESRVRELWEDDGYSSGTYSDGYGNDYHRDEFDSKLRDSNGKTPR